MELIALTKYELEMLLNNKVKSICAKTDKNNEIEIKVVH